MKRVGGSKRERESGQPLAGLREVAPLDSQARVQPSVEMVEKLLSDPRGVRRRHLSHSNFSRQRGEELDLDQITDGRTRVVTNRPLGHEAHGLRAVVRDEDTGVDVHQ